MISAMTAYLEYEEIDTSQIEYPKTGIRLLKFVKTVYSDEVLEKIDKGILALLLNENYIEPNDNFSNYRVHADTKIEVEVDEELTMKLSEILNELKEASPKKWEEHIDAMIWAIKDYDKMPSDLR
jgi:hypothetical protein